MANRKALFHESDVKKVLKAFREAGYPAPVIVLEPGRITAKPSESPEDGWGDYK